MKLKKKFERNFRESEYDYKFKQKNLSKKKVFLKSRIINSLMISGKKEIAEQILNKLIKFLLKSTNKNTINLIQLSIINSTPVFKLNEQIIKQGKRKAIKITPAFIAKNYLRIMFSLKLLNKIAFTAKTENVFYMKLAKEIMKSAKLKSESVNRKNELQKQVLLNKRYVSKFRW